VQASLFLFVLAHAMGKLTTIPLLLKTSPAALPAYLCGAMALYLLYKLARRDFQYWVPTAGAGLSSTGRRDHWSGESLASFTLNFPAIPNSGTRMR
jgi:hypothetical protein